VVFGEIQNK